MCLLLLINIAYVFLLAGLGLGAGTGLGVRVEDIKRSFDAYLLDRKRNSFSREETANNFLEKISELRKTIVERNLDIDIEEDGGIKANWTISQCCAAGANCFIAGSGKFA